MISFDKVSKVFPRQYRVDQLSLEVPTQIDVFVGSRQW